MVGWFIFFVIIVAFLSWLTFYLGAWNSINLIFLSLMSIITAGFLVACIKKIVEERDKISIKKDGKIEISDINLRIKKSLCETVPGMMTGLGLLGTFIGLILGLKDFNTDYEVIQESISNLLGAIKTAFITSIYGVFFSLFFNTVFKNEYSKLRKVCDENLEFQDEETLKNIEAIKDSNSAIQYHISDAFERGLLSIDSNLKKIYKSLTTDITKQFNSSIESLTNQVNDFIENLAQNQEDQLKLLVESYVNKMNEVLGNQFNELGDSLRLINEEGKDISENMKLLSHNLAETSETVISTNNNYSELNDKFVDYIVKINEYQGIITSSNESLNDNLQILAEKYSQTSINTKEIADINVKLNTDIVQLAESCNLLRNESEASRDSREHLIDVVKILVDTSNENRGKMTESVNSLISKIEERTTEFINKSTEIVTTNAANSEQISSELYNTLNSSIENYCNINKTFKEYIDQVNEYQGIITSSNNGLNEKLSELADRYIEQNSSTSVLIDINKLLTDDVKSLTEICNFLKTESEASRENTENLKNSVINLVVSSKENNENTYDTINTLVNTISEKTSDYISKTREFIELTTENSGKISEELYKTVHESLEEKTTSLNEAAVALKESVDSLSSNYSEVTQKLNSGLADTFDQFDSSTSGIVQRFSVLISEIKSIVDNVPAYIGQEISRGFEKLSQERYDRFIFDELDESESDELELGELLDEWETDESNKEKSDN